MCGSVCNSPELPTQSSDAIPWQNIAAGVYVYIYTYRPLMIDRHLNDSPDL